MTATNSPKETDRSVVSLLWDQQEKTDSPVVQSIGKVLDVLDDADLNYGAQVRVLTKALAIVNERHRQAVLSA